MIRIKNNFFLSRIVYKYVYRDSEFNIAMNKIGMDIRRNFSRRIVEKLEIITRNALKSLTKYFSTVIAESSNRYISKILKM